MKAVIEFTGEYANGKKDAIKKATKELIRGKHDEVAVFRASDLELWFEVVRFEPRAINQIRVA